VVGDGRDHRSGSIDTFARDRGQVEPKDRIGLLHESQAHAGRDIRVRDACLDEGERAGHVEVVGQTLAEKLVPAIQRDLAERGGDARPHRRGVLRMRDLREETHALPQVVKALGGLPERGDAEVHACAVVREEALVAEREWIDTQRLDLVDLERVPRRLGHLHAVREQMLAVHPRADDGVPERAFRLRDLVLVMREDVVHAAGMHIESLAKVLRAHRRTLDVPARITAAPRRAPHERAPLGLRVLPEREVRRAALVRIGLGPDALPQRLGDVARKATVRFEVLHRVINGPVHDVGEVLSQELLDEGDHLGHVRRGPRVCRRGQDAELAFVITEGRLVELRDLARRLARGEGRRDDLVLATVDRVLTHMPHVGDVLHGDDAMAEQLEGPPQPIGEQI
jgi:hypothetical protein